MKQLVKLLFFLSAATLCAAGPFRASTALEKKLESAKAEYYRNYDQLEAHFKFAGILYDAGCLESAFCNAESLLKNALDGNAKRFFDQHAKRQLTPLLTSEEREKFAKLPHPQQLKEINNLLLKKSASNPLFAEYLRFSGNPERWNSRDPKDIAFVKAKIAEAIAAGKFDSVLDYNLSCGNYLYLAAKDPENALPCFIRLYFHDPDHPTALQSPLGFTVNKILQTVTPKRRNRAEVLNRHDPVKLILENMHTYPRTVENFLRAKGKEISAEKFVKLCLLASDSVDLQLRSFAFAELTRRDLTPLLPLLRQLLNDNDAGRRAVAALMLPYAIPADKLSEALAELSKDESAIVKMTADNVAKTRCSAEDYAKFQTLLKRK